MSTSNPSITITDASTSTSTPTSTSSQSNTDTATLYLFTFLATILILVLLSVLLVLRSCILRRRYRQRLRQAIADGLFVDFDRSAFNGAGQFDPLSGFRRSTRRLGAKPVLMDTWIRPADRFDTWSSIMPVAVCCDPRLSPSTPIPSSPSSTAPPGSPSSPQTQPRPSFFPRLYLPSFSPLSFRPSPLPEQAHTPTIANIRSPPPVTPEFPDSSTRIENDAAMLVICVLVAMPDVSAPVYRPATDVKGKGVDPLESQAHQQSGDADSLLPSSLHRSGTCIPDFTVYEEGLPLLEFGVVETRTGELAWST